MADDDVQFVVKESQSEARTENKDESKGVSVVDGTVLLAEEHPGRMENSSSKESRKSLREVSRKSIREEGIERQSLSGKQIIEEKVERKSTIPRVKRKSASKSDAPRRLSQTSKSSTVRQSFSSQGSSKLDSRHVVNPKLEKIFEKVELKEAESRKISVDKTSEKSMDDTLVSENKSKILSLESERRSSRFFLRPESPPNPYNRFKYLKMLPQWPFPDQEEPRIGVVNSINSLECGFFPKSPLDHCSCCPSDKDPLNCCAKMVRTEEGCCVSEWIRKEFYYKTKSKVEKAIMVRSINDYAAMDEFNKL